MTELHQGGEVIPRHPHLGDLAIFQAKDSTHLNLHSLAGRRKWSPLGRLRTREGPIKGDQIIFAYQESGCDSGIWSRRCILSKIALEIFEASNLNIRGRLAVTHEIRGHQLVEKIKILVVHYLDEPAYDLLVFFRHFRRPGRRAALDQQSHEHGNAQLGFSWHLLHPVIVFLIAAEM